MKIENFSFIFGIILGVTAVLLLAYMFQEKIAGWYAKNYAAKLGKAVEELEQFKPDFTTLPVGEGVIFKEPIIRALPFGDKFRL